MTEHFRARRTRSTVWTARNPVLERCELGFETDTYRVKMGDGATPWVSLPYMDEGGAATSTPERIVYDTVLLSYPDITLLSDRSFVTDAVNKAPDIARNYDRYSKCLWDIHEVGGPGVWNGLRFGSVFDLYAYVSAFATPGIDPTTYRYEIMATCYDVVNQNVPSINKMYGVNTFYSMLRGHRNYKLSTAAIDGDNLGWMNKASWFSSVCAAGIGFPTPTGYTASRMRAFWMGRTSMNMYGLPYDGFTCGSVTSVDRRYVYNSAAGTWVPATAGRNHKHVTSAPPPGEFNKLWCFFRLNSGGATWDFATYAIEAARQGKSKDRTGICLYRMADTVVSTNRSIYIKPLGIDRVGLNYFDPAAYELYAVYESLDRTTKIKPVTTSAQQESTDLAWVEKMQWFPYDTAPATRFGYHRTGMEAPVVRFMLRDRTTQEISAPSSMCVRLQEGNRNAPTKWLVHRG